MSKPPSAAPKAKRAPKPKAEPVVEAASPAVAPGEEPAILQRLELSPKWNVALVAGGVALAAGLGALAMRAFARRSRK